MKNSVYVFFIILFCISCKQLIINGNIKPIQKRQWTFIVYMAADNDLEYQAIQDFNELEAVSYFNVPISILVLLDRSPAYDNSNENWSGTRLYEIETDPNGFDGVIRSKEINCPALGLIPGHSPNLNTAHYDVLKNVIEFSKKEYKAEKYALIMWGHGTGWRNKANTSTNSFRAFAIDESANSYMTNAEFGKAIKGQGLSIVGFDTCFGGMIETAYEIKNDAIIMIASEGNIPAAGWNYSDLFSSFTKTDLSIREFSNAAHNQFKNQYKTVPKSCISTIDLSQMQKLNDTFNSFSTQAATFIEDLTSRDDVLDAILTETLTFSSSSYPCDLCIDIASFSKNMKRLFPALEAYEQELQSTLQDAVIDSWISSEEETSSLGVYFCELESQFVPSSSHSSAYVQGSETILQTAFVKESTGWVPTVSGTSSSFLDRLFYKVF